MDIAYTVPYGILYFSSEFNDSEFSSVSMEFIDPLLILCGSAIDSEPLPFSVVLSVDIIQWPISLHIGPVRVFPPFTSLPYIVLDSKIMGILVPSFLAQLLYCEEPTRVINPFKRFHSSWGSVRFHHQIQIHSFWDYTRRLWLYYASIRHRDLLVLHQMVFYLKQISLPYR